MRFALASVIALISTASVAQGQNSPSILFVGNSFTFGAGSAVRFYRSGTVTDLNNEGVGGVPALFKSFTIQAGLPYEVFLETRGGSGFEFHLDNKLDVIGKRPWDVVVMQGQSTLDLDKPGDPTKFLATAPGLAKVFHDANPNVQTHMTATWSRADQTYPSTGAWFGKPIEAMAQDVRAAYDKAAQSSPGVKSVIPVGEAWTRAMTTGVADPNPYDGIEFGKLNLWTSDHYHASAYGYYLEALVIFGRVTGRDPRSLGGDECSGVELGFTRAETQALQQVAFDQLRASGSITPNPLVLQGSATRTRCLPAS